MDEHANDYEILASTRYLIRVFGKIFDFIVGKETRTKVIEMQWLVINRSLPMVQWVERSSALGTFNYCIVM